MNNRHAKPPAESSALWEASPGRCHAPPTPEVVDVFNAVRDLPDHERQAALRRHASGDAALHAAVQRLLDAERSPRGEHLAEQLDAALVDIDSALAPPSNVPGGTMPEIDDRYTLVRLLGSGSSGDVYLADQIRPVPRRVAIKVLRPAEVRVSTVERMRREAIALSALDHPGIATIYDAGVTPDGRPYLATEWVDGPPIDRWCAEHAATFATRCGLLAGVCRAVEHAHQRGVIHRDLKPGNILVRMDDGGPTPKIVDLGIARLLEPHHGPGLGLTRGGHLQGTIGYIAPEQLEGGAADVRSDLFALGRVLEGLPGGMEGLAASQRRDAAAIVRRATRTDPRERYQSAGDMADDLEALIDGRPVAARRQSPLEAGFRAVRRHKLATALGAVALVSVVGAVGVVSFQSAQIARKNQTLAESNAALAQSNRAQKEILRDTLDGMVRILSHYPGTREERLAAANLLDRHLARLTALNPGDYELRFLRGRVGVERANIAIQAGDIVAAESIARQAVDMMENAIETSTAPADDLREMAYAIIIWGDSLQHLGQVEEARSQHQRAKAIHEMGVLRFPNHVGLLDDLNWSYDRLGQWMATAADDQEALRALTLARLQLAERLLALDPDRSLSRYNLALAYLRLGLTVETQDPQRAADTYDASIALLEAVLAADPGRSGYAFNLAWALYKRATLFLGENEPAAALPLCERAAHVLVRNLASQIDPDRAMADPQTGALLLSLSVRLADLYEAMGRPHDIANMLRAHKPYADPARLGDYAKQSTRQSSVQRWHELCAAHGVN